MDGGLLESPQNKYQNVLKSNKRKEKLLDSDMTQCMMH